MKKVAVVTGASRGVGFEVARRFAERGWVAVGLSRTEVDGPFESLAVDLVDGAAVRAAFGEIRTRFAQIDLLVNNAAVFKMAPFAECSPEDIDRILDTNLKGTLHCTHAALPLLKRPGGRIIDIGSVAGTHGIRNQAIYCASKFGMDGFAEALGQELLDEGILVTTLCPGGIDTPLWNEGNPYPGDRRRILRTEDVVRMVEYVADLPEHVVLKKVVVFPANEWH